MKRGESSGWRRGEVMPRRRADGRRGPFAFVERVTLHGGTYKLGRFLDDRKISSEHDARADFEAATRAVVEGKA
jgi:hypothetical protein